MREASDIFVNTCFTPKKKLGRYRFTLLALGKEHGWSKPEFDYDNFELGDIDNP